MTVVEGTRIGRVNGLAVTGSDAGSVLPIMAEVTPAIGKEGGEVIATGLLKEIAQESIKNVSAILKKFTGKDVKNIDIHIQFIGTYMGVEGDSASVSVATAVVSAIEGIPVRQDVAMTIRSPCAAMSCRWWRDIQNRGCGKGGDKDRPHPPHECRGRAYRRAVQIPGHDHTGRQYR